MCIALRVAEAATKKNKTATIEIIKTIRQLVCLQLTRYDIVSIRAYEFPSVCLQEGMLIERSTDFVSILIDLITLFCLIISILIALFISKKSNINQGIKFSYKRVPAIIFISVGLCLMAFYLFFKRTEPYYPYTVVLIIIQ